MRRSSRSRQESVALVPYMSSITLLRLQQQEWRRRLMAGVLDGSRAATTRRVAGEQRVRT